MIFSISVSRFFSFLCLFLPSTIFTVLAQPVSGTSGTPLGGFGAGAVKFNANTGTFAVMTRQPADAYDFVAAGKSGFRFFCERSGQAKVTDPLKAVFKNGEPDDDAIWPLHKVNFGKIEGVQINFEGFSPLDNQHYDNMSLPYAFYEIKVTNEGKADVDVSCAMAWDAGENPFTWVAGKGVTNKDWTVYASSSDTKAVITAGNDDDPDFARTGLCSNKIDRSQGLVAVKIKLSAGQSQYIRFVLSWYDHTDPELAYYKALYKAPAPIAEKGLTEFSGLKVNAETLVNRMQSSNLPNWLKNQTLNTLANLTTNSMYKKDGRVAFAEGQWTCFGTMDQMWHARQIIGQLLPFFAWQELRYWARTQKKNGQIHHDFNKMDVGPVREKRSELVAWDDTEHSDYRNVDKWVDLNCAMIISTYEIYQQTADRQQMAFLWPYLKKAAQRILDQVGLYGNKEYPFTFDHSENSYDAGGDPDPFNASLSAVAYKVMTKLATQQNEPELAKTYQHAFETTVKSFESRYLNGKNFHLGKHCESFFSGQWLALNLKLGQIWSTNSTNLVLKQLDSYYHPYYRGMGYAKGTYDEWTPYLLTHYGGLLLNTKRANQWYKLQKDAYNRQYENRDMVFDHPLNILPVVKSKKPIATNLRSGNQYISMPAIWRNYYDLIGFHHDANTGELWLTPVVGETVNHHLQNAFYVSPNGYGQLSCKESGKYFQNKDILISADKGFPVRKLRLADNFGKLVSVSVNGKPMPFKRIGVGYSKEVVVSWNGKISPKAVSIRIAGDPGSAPPDLPAPPVPDSTAISEKSPKLIAYEVIEAEDADKSAGVKIKSSSAIKYVGSCNNFDYIQFSNVDFGASGSEAFYAKVASKAKGGSIEIVLDNVAGESVGSCAIPDTGGWDSWLTVSCAINKVTGIHNVFLRFSGTTAEDLMNIDKLTFRKNMENAGNVLK